MPPTRRRDAVATRAAILDAAREVFGREGYERATMRAVAAAAGVDAALVVRYFGSKADLFAEAAHLRLDLPVLAGLTPEQVADAVVTRFLQVWEDDSAFLALLRAAATSEDAAARLRRVFAQEALPVIAAAAVDRPQERVALAGSQVIGFAYARYVLEVPLVADLDHDAVRRLLGPAVARLLTDPL